MPLRDNDENLEQPHAYPHVPSETLPTSGAQLASVMGYDDIVREIQNAPLTWAGGLLAKAVSEAKRKHFFKDDAAIIRFVTKVVNENRSS